MFYILFGLVSLGTGAANANWQYSGEYTYNPYERDDGARTVVSLRGGATFAFAKMQNDVGSVVSEYYVNYNTGEVISAAQYDICTNCSDFQHAGTGELGKVGLSENLSGNSFTAGASIGFALPEKPQWRLELGWDHFSKVDYNVSPLFKGNMDLTGGDIINVESGSIQSTMSSDIISVMAFYDFFGGIQKPLHTMIPYIGLGVGYADTETVVNLADPWGDLSSSEDLTNFGEVNSNNIIQFYKSTSNSVNVSGLAALGFSYGLKEYLFLDFGARVAYIPRVKYVLTNADDTRKLDWISAKNLFYTNVMIGLRFEF
ncbi:MAG: hypothetical protein K5912_00735 [Alphaproteobacteria bacterium]|nr:hypothetical protein [Alphaproteobacteria bacterium]